MEIAHKQENNASVLSLKGSLSLMTVAELDAAFKKIVENGAKKIIVDCGELEYISSAGLRVFLAAAKALRKNSGHIVLAALSPNVRQVFEISGFTSIFAIVASSDDALAKE